MWYWDSPSPPSDCGSGSFAAYFRYKVSIPSTATIISGSALAAADDDYDLYVNGNFVLSGGIQASAIDFTEFLTRGDNVIAIRAQDTVGLCEMMLFDGSIRIGSIPAMPSALSVSPTAVRLTWKDSGGERSYRIQRKEGLCSSTNAWAVRADVGANTLTLLDTGLLASTPYSYRVRAYYGAGSFSEFSPCVSATTAAAGTPHIPVNLRAFSRSDTRIDLYWQDSSENETAFDIYRRVGTDSWALLDRVSEGRQSYSDLAAAGNSATVPYRYDVRACNASGCSRPNLPTVLPFWPSSLAATVDSAVKLTWKDNSSDESSFHVERRNGNCASDTPWSVLRVLPPNTQAYTDASAVSGTAYAYRALAGFHTDGSPRSYGKSRHTGCVRVRAP